MKRVFLASIAALALSASAASAQSTATSVSGSGGNPTSDSSSITSSSALVNNMAGSIGNVDIATNVLPDLFQRLPGGGLSPNDVDHLQDVFHHHGAGFGEESGFGCEFVANGSSNNCAASQ